MINKIYSKVNPSLILHIIYTNDKIDEKISSKKVNSLTEPEHCLQVMAFEMPAGTKSNPHKHNIQERRTTQTHEALLLLKGSIELFIYDIDDSFVDKKILNEGDCYVIINGGHNIQTLGDVKFFEFKNGPYYGPEKDKTNIN